MIADAEKEKLQKEYEEFDKQLNEAKDEYTKENPDAAHKEPDEQEYVSVKQCQHLDDCALCPLHSY